MKKFVSKHPYWSALIVIGVVAAIVYTIKRINDSNTSDSDTTNQRPGTYWVPPKSFPSFNPGPGGPRPGGAGPAGRVGGSAQTTR